MRHIIFAVFLLLPLQSLAGSIGYPAAAPVIELGGRVLSDTSSLKMLYCNISTNTRCTPRIQSGTSGYVVPASKTFYVKVARAVCNGVAGGGMYMGYGDTDVGNDSLNPPTNPVCLGGDCTLQNTVISRAINTDQASPVDFTIPTGKYPYLASKTTGGVCTFILYGYEQ